MWVRVCSVSEIAGEDIFGFEVSGRPVAIYNLGGKYYATEALCTHEQANLVDGYLCDGIIECPKHNARFEVSTGKCLRRPAKVDLKTFPVKGEGGEIYIQVEGE